MLAGNLAEDSPAFESSATLTRVGPEGAPIWSRMFDVPGDCSSGIAVRELDGQQVAFGFSSGFTNIAVCLARVNGAGAALWVKRYPGSCSYPVMDINAAQTTPSQSLGSPSDLRGNPRQPVEYPCVQPGDTDSYDGMRTEESLATKGLYFESPCPGDPNGNMLVAARDDFSCPWSAAAFATADIFGVRNLSMGFLVATSSLCGFQQPAREFFVEATNNGSNMTFSLYREAESWCATSLEV